MKAKHNDVYEIIGICENCENAVWGRRLAEGVLVIEPCECCRDEAFNEGYEAGYADLEVIEELDMEKGGKDADSESQE